MLIAGSNIEEINNLKKQLSKQFAMKDLGPAKQILDLSHSQSLHLSVVPIPYTLSERSQLAPQTSDSSPWDL